MSTTILGKKIAFLLERNQINSKQLADTMGVRPGVLTAMCRCPAEDLLLVEVQLAADALRVTLDYLINQDRFINRPSVVTAEADFIRERFLHATGGQQVAIFGILENVVRVIPKRGHNKGIFARCGVRTRNMSRNGRPYVVPATGFIPMDHGDLKAVTLPVFKKNEFRSRELRTCSNYEIRNKIKKILRERSQ